MTAIRRRLGLSPAQRGSMNGSTCPDVFELESGDFFVIGKTSGVPHVTARELQKHGASVGDDEQAVIVPRDVLEGAARDLLHGEAHPDALAADADSRGHSGPQAASRPAEGSQGPGTRTNASETRTAARLVVLQRDHRWTIPDAAPADQRLWCGNDGCHLSWGDSDAAPDGQKPGCPAPDPRAHRPIGDGSGQCVCGEYLPCPHAVPDGEPCAGFPDTCSNLRPVEAGQGQGGGIRCGCAEQSAAAVVFARITRDPRADDPDYDPIDGDGTGEKIGLLAMVTPEQPDPDGRQHGDRFQVWPVSRILAETVPGSADWTWTDEFADLDTSHANELQHLSEMIELTGVITPLLIGDDGRLWDGHHRLRIAVALGVTHLAVEHATPPAADHTPEQPA